jgi:hypothetical protein
VPYTPCSVAELFLNGCLTSEDILPGGRITDETRLRAERNHAEQVDRQTRDHPRDRQTRDHPRDRRPRDRLPARRPSTARSSTAAHVDRIRIRRLEAEATPDETTSILGNCSVCLTRTKAFACVPCYHMCVCSVCKERVAQCPLCRASVGEFVRIFW